jgi:hypothetical protein
MNSRSGYGSTTIVINDSRKDATQSSESQAMGQCKNQAEIMAVHPTSASEKKEASSEILIPPVVEEAWRVSHTTNTNQPTSNYTANDYHQLVGKHRGANNPSHRRGRDSNSVCIFYNFFVNLQDSPNPIENPGQGQARPFG